MELRGIHHRNDLGLSEKTSLLSRTLDSPFVVFAISLAAQYVAAYLGDLFRKTRLSLWEDERQDFDLV
jgi:hypothetical protein